MLEAKRKETCQWFHQNDSTYGLNVPFTNAEIQGNLLNHYEEIFQSPKCCPNNTEVEYLSLEIDHSSSSASAHIVDTDSSM